ncbi:MAG: N-acyl homoserine lactonase family protein [Halobacteriota archaeon]
MTGISVTLVDRGRVRADVGYVQSGYTMADAKTPNPSHEIGDFVVWSAVVETADGTYLFDTGCPPDADTYWPEPLYDAFEPYDAADRSLSIDLGRNGYAIDDMDAVVMSHLHLDHVGELDRFEGADVPVYVHRAELPFAYFSAKTSEGSIAYLAEDFDGEYDWQIVHGDSHTIVPGFELLHLPGHTPGLLGARIDLDGGDRTLLIAGDEAYVDANYTDGVPLGPGLLWSRPDWKASLNRLREIERQTDASVLYGHDLDRFEEIDSAVSS